MRWIAILILIALNGCTVRIEPLDKAKKKTSYRSSSKPAKKKPPKENVQNSYVTVSSNWLENYQTMENEFNHRIPDDHKITPEGDKFRVPKTVINHYNDMIKAQSAPTSPIPTATPEY